MTKLELSAELTFLASLWQRFEVTAETLAAWYETIGDQPRELLHAAILDCARTSNHAFAPSVSEIMKAIRRLTHGERLSALEAWNQRLSDPLAKKAYEVIGGSKMWRESLVSDQPFIRNRFCQVYEAMSEREEREEMSHPEAKKFLGQFPQLVKKLAK